MITMRVLIAGCLCVAAFSAAAQLYRWTDPSGAVHFSDVPPPAGAKNVQKKRATVSSSSGTPVEPYALQQAVKNFPVTLYSAPGCEACARARKLLNARGVPFKEVSVTQESQIAELTNAVGANWVPALIVGRSVQKGFEQGAYHEALDTAGYPKTGEVRPRSQAEPKALEPAAGPKSESQPAEEPPASGPYAPRPRR